jgi:hypothetical protein
MCRFSGNSGIFNLLETSGSAQACNWIDAFLLAKFWNGHLNKFMIYISVLKRLNLGSPDNSPSIAPVTSPHLVSACENVELIRLNLLFVFFCHCVSFIIIGKGISDTGCTNYKPRPTTRHKLPNAITSKQPI